MCVFQGVLAIGKHFTKNIFVSCRVSIISCHRPSVDTCLPIDDYNSMRRIRYSTASIDRRVRVVASFVRAVIWSKHLPPTPPPPSPILLCLGRDAGQWSINQGRQRMNMPCPPLPPPSPLLPPPLISADLRFYFFLLGWTPTSNVTEKKDSR